MQIDEFQSQGILQSVPGVRKYEKIPLFFEIGPVFSSVHFACSTLSLSVSEMRAFLLSATIIPHIHQHLPNNCKHSLTSRLMLWALTPVAYGSCSPTDVSVPQSHPQCFLGEWRQSLRFSPRWPSPTRSRSLAWGQLTDQGSTGKTQLTAGHLFRTFVRGLLRTAHQPQCRGDYMILSRSWMLLRLSLGQKSHISRSSNKIKYRIFLYFYSHI